MGFKRIDRGRKEKKAGKWLFLLAGLIIPLIISFNELDLKKAFKSKEPAVVPAVLEEKKEDPADSLAAAEKIAGYANPEALISVYELNRIIFEPDTFILDTRGRSYQVYTASYFSGHIPGAVPILHEQYSHPKYFDRIVSPLQLESVLGKLGAGNGKKIVLYGNDGLQARVYWAFKMYGYDNVRILDGGLDKWKAAGFDITAAVSARPADTFEFDLNKLNTESFLATLNEVENALDNPGCIIVDARSRDEYLYKHIPGSVNLYCGELLNGDQTFKPASDLKALAESKKVAGDKKIIVYSDSGIRSSMVWFALTELLGYPDVKNYDGSFNEWLKQGRRVQSGEGR